MDTSVQNPGFLKMKQQNDNIPAGIGLMLLTMFFFVTLDATAKYLMQFYPTAQVIWGRFFFHMILVIAVLLSMKAGIKDKIASNKPGLQIARSFLMLATNGLFFLGIRTVDLTTASTILFLTPIVVTILSIPVLGERVGMRRWIGVVIGFIGAMIIIRPGVIELDMGNTDSGCINFYSRLLPDLYSTGTGLRRSAYIPVIHRSDWFYCDVHYHTFPMAMARTRALADVCTNGVDGLSGAFLSDPFPAHCSGVGCSTLFLYNFIWATGFSYVLFDELPDYWVFAGAALIVASGLYILHREQKTKPSPDS